jgi:hypothetical protein
MWHLTGFSGVRVYGILRSLFFLRGSFSYLFNSRHLMCIIVTSAEKEQHRKLAVNCIQIDSQGDV